MYLEQLYLPSEMCSNQLHLYSHMYYKHLLQIFVLISQRVFQIFTPIFHYVLQDYYYYYYLLQLSFHSVAVSLTLVTNKNKYT
jgi:hypothetical protein